MKGIERCGECGYYDWNRHRCTNGAHKDPNPRAPFFSDCPLKDVQPVVHGKWMPFYESEISGFNPEFAGRDPIAGYECSECGVKAIFDCNDQFVLSSYCPNCGAKMDEEKTE